MNRYICPHDLVRQWQCLLCGRDLWPVNRLRLLVEYGAKIDTKGVESLEKVCETVGNQVGAGGCGNIQAAPDHAHTGGADRGFL